ncbi:class I SAM-dependent methyltransferase [bacterium]|nr:class I SAM-dependent methyltransferase [bacterium]
MTANPRESYWEKKIQRWAESSYEAERRGVLDKLRTSIDARKETALQVIEKHANRGGKLLDLGCGAGQFAIEAARRGLVDQSIGVDFARPGIEAARKMAEDLDLSEAVRFEVASVLDFPIDDDVTIVTGLGLLDWLHHDEVLRLFERVRGRHFVLSYSEQDNSLAEIVHRLWLCERLRWFGGGVRAYHHKRTFIENAAHQQAGADKVSFVKNREMRFGTLAHNLG